MKYITVIILLIAGLNVCGQKNDNIETVLLNCLENSYNKIGVDIYIELDKLEQYLIEKGFLSSTSGQSYYDFYKQIIAVNHMPSKLETDKLDNLLKLKPDNYYSDICLQRLTKVDSSEIKTSKYYQMVLKMQEISSNERISSSSVARALTSILTPSDFDKPYYRAIALLTIVNISNIEKTLVRKTIDYSDGQKVLILINSKNEIIYNQELVNKRQLKDKLYNFIKQNQANHLIVFSNEKGTAYHLYLKIHNCISETYIKLRNEKSKEFYNKLFSDLTNSEKEKIIKIYPQNINNQ